MKFRLDLIIGGTVMDSLVWEPPKELTDAFFRGPEGEWILDGKAMSQFYAPSQWYQSSEPLFVSMTRIT